MKVRMIFAGELLEEREFDRVPCMGELIWVNDSTELYVVSEVFWLQNGRANLLVSNRNDIIDSRDVIARIDDLEDELKSLHDSREKVLNREEK